MALKRLSSNMTEPQFLLRTWARKAIKRGKKYPKSDKFARKMHADAARMNLRVSQSRMK